MIRTGKPIRAVRALATFATAALLSASAGAGVASAETASFASTGGEQTFTVPAGVASLHVTAVGGRGGGLFGGFGAVAQATVPVTPGQTLFVNVGGNGIAGGLDGNETGPPGGFNGGGSGGRGSIAFDAGDSGGGATDVRSFSRSQPSSLGTRLVVAGGGGGGSALGTAGGAAGSPGATGETSQPSCTGGTGGSQGTASSGGAGGAPGKFGLAPPVNPDGMAGTDGQIGDGGSGGGDILGGGGGGGGGLFGGGGGASATGDHGVYVACPPGGGGGGSSGFVASATSTSVSPDTSGVPSVTLEWTAAAPGPPTDPGSNGRDTVAPAISALSLSRTAFVAANFGPPAVAAARVGTTVSYRVSEAARVTFTVERPKPGIRRGGRCVKRTRKAPANAKKCMRWVQVKGSFAQDAAAGPNSIRFMGRLRGRALRKGSYRLVVTAKDAAGNTAARPARRGFKIV